MNTQEWLEAFTGQKADSGQATGPDPELATRAVEEELALKAALLAEAHKRIAPVKVDFQKAMASEVKIKGKWAREKMLAVEGTQTDEADFTEIDFASVKLEPETQAVVTRGSTLIMLQGEHLAAATTERDGKKVPLFTPVEIEDGYWFPLTRERILPETFVGDLYSKTQRMLDETNEAYLSAVEEKRKKGELTPKARRAQDLVQSGADLLSIAGSMTAAFGPGSEGAQLASQVLNGMSQVVSGAGDAYDKLAARKYTDGAQATLSTLQILTTTVLSAAGVDKSVITIVGTSFTIGGQAITAGKAFARGVDGAADGVSVLADVLAGALNLAAANTSGGTQTDLQLAASTAPNVLRAAATSPKLIQALQKGDASGVVDCLGQFATQALDTVQGVREAEAPPGSSSQQALQNQTTQIQGIIDLGTAAGKTTVAMAIAARRGQYQKVFDTLIDAIGANLTDALTTAGLPDDTARQIGLLYSSASSGAKAVECLIKDPTDVAGALTNLSAGVATAFQGAAPGVPALQKVGQGVASALQGLADVKGFHDQCAAGDYDGAFATFSKGFQGQLSTAFNIAGVQAPSTDDDGGDGDSSGDSSGSGGGDDGGSGGDTAPGAALKQALLDLGVEAKKAEKLIAEHVDDAVENEVQKAGRQEAEEEAQAILAEAKAELSDPEKFAHDAANIDALIARITRDRMIMKIAVQVMEGGTAFLATFIPGLGAAPAAIKMMASLVAAAQRAQQLAYWVNSQSDLEAAQSALSSSAQNFVMNQAEQFSHYTIQAAFAAAEMIGQVLRVAGAATYGAMEAAGAGLVAASKAGAKLEEIIRRHYKTEQLEYAWRLTQRAIRNPRNRKLGLRARAQNPSLAKYSIAWGAVKLKDPIARQALRACELTEAVLENENANIDKVVQYLESFYEEDDKLYREVDRTAKWIPQDIALTLRFWSRLKTLAVTNVKLQNTDTGVLDGLLAQLKGDVSQGTEVAQRERIQLLTLIDRELGAYTPQIKDDAGRKAFESVIKLMRGQARSAISTLQAQIDTAAKASEARSEQAQKERAKALEDRGAVLEELRGRIAVVQSFEDDDETADLVSAQEEALALIKEVSALKPLGADKEVQATVGQLQKALEPLDVLITQAELPMV